MNEKQIKALKMISDAITNEDINPKHHKLMDDRLRKDWPTLWRAVHYAADVYREESANS